MKFRWSLSPPQPVLAGHLAQDLGVSALLAQCLINRGLGESSLGTAFLQPRLRQLADPFLLPNMAIAVDRLFHAREARERVVIFGDYDVDGVTSTCLLLEVLRALGWEAECYLPHRMDEGYGLSAAAVQNCLARFPTKLLLAVDCGSTSVESIDWLKEQGVDVVVLDHHQVSAPPPRALALVNPQLHSPGGPQPGIAGPPEAARSAPDQPQPPPGFLEMCSAGLAFKLAHALLKRGRELELPGAESFDLRLLLDLVALGTVADLVPLTGENRILVTAGFDRLNATQRPGLIALKRIAQSPAVLGTYEVGFQIAPRLNAAGRLETAETALRLLLTRDSSEAGSLARNLDQCNRERQKVERGIAEEAIAAVRAKFQPATDFAIVEGQSPWHVGVVGIVASRVLQRFYRPTVIVGGEGEEWRGSGRSVAGFDLAAGLRECSDLLVRHGGHAMAAGLTIQRSNLDAFRVRLNEVARRALTPEMLQPLLRLDAEVGLEEMTLDCIRELDQLKPVGQGNPAVHFFARRLGHQRPLQRMGADKQHVKMWVTDGTTSHEAVWWAAGNEPPPVGSFDLAFAPQHNDYNGRTSVQLKVFDWQPSDPGSIQ